MDGREADAARLLARVFIEAGRFAQARDILSGLIEVDPDDAFARRNLVLVLLRLREYGAAEPLARRLVAGASGAERGPALFFHAYALWGLGREDECRDEVERYAACLAEQRAE